MTVSYFVRYQGMPAPADPFIDYYRTRHAAILADFPGIRSLTLHTPVGWTDRYPDNPDPPGFPAQMTFDSAAALAAALQSEARAGARDDFAKLPPVRGPVTHLATASERLF
jgi:uncharacterized protein (TIGR02118 family)